MLLIVTILTILTRPTHGGNLDWAVSIANCPLCAIVDFSASINPLGPPQSAIDAILNQGLSQLKDYPNPNYPLFREVIADKYNLNPRSILPANGAAELLTWMAWEVKSLKGVLLPAPCFADYKRALATFNLHSVSYPLNAIETGFDIVHPHQWALLINNPHNPTGKLWNRETLLPYLRLFALVIIDEAFMDFLPPNQQQSLLAMVSDYDNLVILRSLTKFYSLPGLRIGYGVSHQTRIDRWQKWRDPWSVNTLASIAGSAVIQDTEFEKLTWQWLPKAKQKLVEQLSSIKQLNVFPSQTNFLLVESKGKMKVPELQLKLLQQEQIFIRDCLSFPELGEKYFRVAIKHEEQNERLAQSIDRIIIDS